MVKIEVNEGKIPWIVGIGTILFGMLYAVLCLRYPDRTMKSTALYYFLVCFGAAIIILAGVWLCLDARNRKLVVEDTALCYTNWCGRKTVFSLSDIAYCRTVFENDGSRNYLKLYDIKDNKLCKLEYNMTDCTVFLQYLIDNQVKIDCLETSDYSLKSMLHMTSISQEAIPDVVNAGYKEAKELVWKWIEDNRKFGVEWKMGIAAYLSQEISVKKQLWEQKSYDVKTVNLPEGYIVAIEGYLLKDGEFVINRKNEAICFFIPIIGVSKSMKIGETLKISHFRDAQEELSIQLSDLADALPRNRYHTEALSLNHELIDSL